MKKQEQNTGTKKSSNAAAGVTANTQAFLFGRRNYMVLIAGLAVMAIGYLLMTGGSQAPDQWDPKVVYGFVRITVSSILVTVGLVIALFSIFVKHNGD